MSTPPFLTVQGDDVQVRVKAVPGAKRDEIAGVLGDRLKIRVAQPPEGGRANDAIRSLLAERLRVAVRDIEIVQGASSPQKTLRIRGVGADPRRFDALT